MIDADLAELYGVETRILNQAVKRNSDRFPPDFIFQLSSEEAEWLEEHLGPCVLRSQIAISKDPLGGRRYLPVAFTEQGVAMLSSVLRSPRAVQVSIAITRAFLKATHRDLARRLKEMKSKYDAQFKLVFDAIRKTDDHAWEAAAPHRLRHAGRPIQRLTSYHVS